MLACLILTSCQQIGKEQAIGITKGFVDKEVKFYVNTNNESSTLSHADITILSAEKKDNNWNIYLNVKSNETGQIKQSNLLIIINAKTGQIADVKKI